MDDLKKLIKLYQSVFLLDDPSVIPLIIAVVISARMVGDPIWLMLVGASSSGKTELLNVISDVFYCKEVDLVTPNTFLSGMKGQKGKETSLLLKMDRQGVMVMKDFTTILSMNKEDQQAIMGQFRQIFDGAIVKDTGTGEKLEWKGKLCLLAGVTEKIHVVDERFSSMGTRFINYTMPLQDRIKITKRSSEIIGTIDEKRTMLKEAFKKYIEEMIPKVKDKFIPVNEKIGDRLVMLADMSTLARSPIERNYKGDIELAYSPEMPMRLSNQLHMLGGIFMTMFDGELPLICEKALYKIAIDSIPKGRRITLEALARFTESTTKRIAVTVNYDNDRTKKWLQELNILGLVERIDRSSHADMWLLKQPFSGYMHEYGGIIQTAEADPYSGEIGTYDPRVDEEQRIREEWKSFDQPKEQ